MTDLVGHFLVFALVAIGFLMVPLIVGRLLRPKLPTSGKRCNLRMRRTGDRFQLYPVRPAVLRGRPAVHHLRRGSGVLLSVGVCLRQHDAAG